MAQPTLLFLCGSLNRASANRAVLDTAERLVRRLELANVTNYENLGDVPPLDPDPSIEIPSAVATLRRLIGAADAVLIAAPEYGGAIAGTIKNALDWVVGSGEFYDKPVALLSAGTTGGVFARQMMNQTLTWQGARVIADLGISAPRTKSDEYGEIVDSQTISDIETVVRRLIASIGF